MFKKMLKDSTFFTNMNKGPIWMKVDFWLSFLTHQLNSTDALGFWGQLPSQSVVFWRIGNSYKFDLYQTKHRVHTHSNNTKNESVVEAQNEPMRHMMCHHQRFLVAAFDLRAQTDV